MNEFQAFSTSNKNLDNWLHELTSLVKKLALGKAQITRVFGIYTSLEHLTYLCPTLQDSSNVDFPRAYAINIYNPQPNNYDR